MNWDWTGYPTSYGTQADGADLESCNPLWNAMWALEGALDVFVLSDWKIT